MVPHTVMIAQPTQRTEERDQLILAHLPMVMFTAKSMSRQLTPLLSMGDLVHAGVVALLCSFEKYDEGKGNTFKTYAQYRVKGAMLDEMYTVCEEPRGIRENRQAIQHARKMIAQRLGRRATDEEVATFLGVTIDEFYKQWAQVNSGQVLKLDELVTNKENGTVCKLMDLVVTHIDEDPAYTVEKNDLHKYIAVLVERLPYREKTVVKMYYFQGLPLTEICKVLHVKGSRASQIHREAVLHLRRLLSE